MSKRFEWYDIREISIYVLKDNEKNCYIGQTSQRVEKRYKQHLWCAMRYKNNPDKYSDSDLERTSKWIASKDDCSVEIVVVDTISGYTYEAKKLEYLWRCIAVLNGYRVVDVPDPFSKTYDDIQELARARKDEWCQKVI